MGVSFDFMCGCCYLDHTRNMLATRFMESEATDLLFVDADVGFAPETILQIAAARRPLVAGIYPKKSDRTGFPVTFSADELWSDEEGLIEAASAPTGFMRINRSVFEAMPAEEYRDQDDRAWRRWFRCDFHDGTYWGEDTQFCQDYRALGGKLFILPDLTFAHSGLKSWKGNWGEWVRSQQMEKAA